MRYLTVVTALVVIGACVSDDAQARRGIGGFHGRPTIVHRSHVVVGASSGFFLFSPSWWSPVYRTPYAPAEPIVYIEQPKAPEAYWYYCAQPAGYYPEVSECPDGWLQVAPQPANASAAQ